MKKAVKIVVLDGYTLNPGDLSWAGFESLGELTVYDRTSEHQVIQRIGDAAVVITNKTPISRETLDACPHIEYIGVLATGYNVADIEAAKEKHIPVTNIPTYGTDAVAQMVFALLLEICHHVGHHDEAVRQGRWSESPDWCFWDYPLIELAGKTLGIIGFGRIGKAAAKIARAFGMHVIAYDATPSAEGSEFGEYVTLDELLSRSDVISLHCPLLPSTSHIINKTTIAKMKTGVILINTSRGQLINEQDLKDALEAGKIAYAAVDVASTEPISAGNPLLTARNCIITPHIAWAPKESRKRLMDIAVNNLAQYLKGRMINVVN